jgi:hypothetical protein
MKKLICLALAFILAPAIFAQNVDQDCLQWQIKMKSAQQRLRSGNALMFTGFLATITNLVLYNFDTEKTYLYEEVISEKKKPIYLVFLGAGLAFELAGYVISSSAKAELNALKEEGKIKGYLKASLFPRHFAITAGISF